MTIYVSLHTDDGSIWIVQQLYTTPALPLLVDTAQGLLWVKFKILSLFLDIPSIGMPQNRLYCTTFRSSNV